MGPVPARANHPETTRCNYLLAAAQLGRYLAEHSPDPDADTAAGERPCAPRYAVGHQGPHRRKGVESSQRLGRHRWVIERTMSWLMRYRRLVRRYDRYAGFVSLAAALICQRHLLKITS